VNTGARQLDRRETENQELLIGFNFRRGGHGCAAGKGSGGEGSRLEAWASIGTLGKEEFSLVVSKMSRFGEKATS